MAPKKKREEKAAKSKAGAEPSEPDPAPIMTIESSLNYDIMLKVTGAILKIKELYFGIENEEALAIGSGAEQETQPEQYEVMFAMCVYVSLCVYANKHVRSMHRCVHALASIQPQVRIALQFARMRATGTRA